MTTEQNKTPYDYQADIYPEDQAWLQDQLGKVTFASILRSHRLCQEWTQQETADKLGITKQMLSAYEREVSFPSLKKAYDIALAIQMPPNVVLMALINGQLRKSNIDLKVNIAS